jgi:Tfp pilus assembly protein PilV
MPTRVIDLHPLPRRARGGFTLLELLIGLTVLMIGVSGILAMHVTAMRATAYSRHATEATVLAEDKMEELRTQPVAAGSDHVNGQGLPEDGGFYERIWTVAPIAGGGAVLTVRVQWLERGRDEHAIVLRTQRAP